MRDAGVYGIPYRALVPRGVDNLLIAGRMTTVELVAHNSTRNTVCCLVCGQAAGTAAAMAAAANRSPVEVDRQELRDRLLKGGVLLEPRPTALEGRADPGDAAALLLDGHDHAVALAVRIPTGRHVSQRQHAAVPDS